MPEKRRIGALLILRMLQEEYPVKEKRFTCVFLDLEKAFDRIPRKMLEWGMRKE